MRRWEEKEGLPIRRLQHDKRGSVYAYPAELDAWRESRQQLVASEPAEAVEPVRSTTTSDAARSRSWGWVAVSTAVVLAVVTGGFLLFGRDPRSTSPGGGSADPEALRAYKQAEFSINPGRVQVESGIRNYQEAIRLDPGFGAAWSGLASAHVAQTWFSDLSAGETMAGSKRAAERALRIDGMLAGPWRALGAVSHYYDWEHATAEHHYRKALDLDPSSSVTLSWYAELLVDLERFDEAVTYVRRSQDATPRWLEPITVSGNIHLFTGHPDLAIAEYRRALAIEPSFNLANHFLGRAYLAAGDGARAVEQLRKSDALIGHVPFTRGDLGYALAATGRRDEAAEILADLIRRREAGFYPAFPIAAIHMGLGDTEAALTWLERATDDRQVGYYFPSVDPIYDPVRGHPRFRALMSRWNLGS